MTAETSVDCGMPTTSASTLVSIVVNENGMCGFETNTCIVEHVHGLRDGEVFLRGKESVDLDIPRHRVSRPSMNNSTSWPSRPLAMVIWG